MPIPLGVFAVAGAGGAAAGAYEQIATAFGTGSSGTITFSGIDQSYRHLQLRYVAQAGTTGDPTLYVRINGNTGATSYASHNLWATGANVLSNFYGPTDHMDFKLNIPLSTVTNVHGAAIIDILDYAVATKNKTIRSFNGMTRTGLNTVALSSGMLVNTAAVTSISIFSFSATLSTTSRFSLYGIKG